MPDFTGGTERRTKNDNETAREEDSQGAREARPGEGEACKGSREIRGIEGRGCEEIDGKTCGNRQAAGETGQDGKNWREG
jgi:hypothetical protein